MSAATLTRPIFRSGWRGTSAAMVCMLCMLLSTEARSQESGGPPMALQNAQVIDGTGRGPIAGMTVLIADGVIEQVFRSGERPLPRDARVIDLTGRYVIPGLINTHVHFLQLSTSGQAGRFFDREAVLAELTRSLYAGVTTVHEAVAGDIVATAELARTAALGKHALPTIHYAQLVAGPTFFEADVRVGSDPDDHRRRGEVTAESNLQNLVSWADSIGASGLKIFTDLGPELIGKVAAAARRRGIRSWAHATVFPTRPSDVVRAGVNTISHVCGLPWEVLPSVPSRFAERPQFDPAEVDAADARFTTLFAEMQRRGVVLDATMYIYSRPGAQRRGCAPELMVGLARSAHESGVLISTGTDFFNDPGEPYPSLHMELVNLVETGVMSPSEAITAATLNGARAIGIEESHGTIEPGKVADLVILEADPTEDIHAVRQVSAVVKGGRLYWRSEFDAGASRR